jgi:hypothetical protein
MMNDIMEYMKSENFEYLIIEASHGDYFGFNLRVKMERTYVKTIASPNERVNFMVVGWKVVKKLPNWVCEETRTKNLRRTRLIGSIPLPPRTNA